MSRLAIALTALLLGVSGFEAATANDKLAFWEQQRKGANGGGAGRDFLLGDADRFEGVPGSDLRRLIEVLDIAEKNSVKIVMTMFSLPGARWRQHNDNQFDYRLWNEEELQTQAMAFWKELAGHLRHHSAVVGYNPLNEPHPARQAGFESFIGKMRDELLNREIFYTLQEAQVLIERWRWEYNQVRPHSSLGYRPPAPEAVEWPPGATRRETPVMNGFLT